MTVKELKNYYNSEEFLQNMCYDGDGLGVKCSESGTVFKIWSPLAERVLLNLYEAGDSVPCFQQHEMRKGIKGLWECEFTENLHGTYYDYTIWHEESTVQTADPYARACGVNGQRSMAVELSQTDPEGWSEDAAPAKETEDIIYELHVKEFSWDVHGGFPEEYRGKYKAFTVDNTQLDKVSAFPTGITYLKHLGVNYIQLMPVFDFGSVDEASEDEAEFNWGYDPVNYNVPEGSYATDARHGEVRIRELKELIQSLHRNGFRVIMDVVYNHTYSADSWLGRTVPGYYYRSDDKGGLYNGSACGNDIASERYMCGRYILDSVLYWTEEYHIDGFRFDLMGLLDTGLMNRIRRELDIRYGKGEKLVFGEPWAAADSPMDNQAIPALKKNLLMLDENIGIFCDNTRDAIKGHIFKEEKPGFVNGGSGFENIILKSVTAWCGNQTDMDELHGKAPSQIITYASAHDNLTLWDKLMVTLAPGQRFKPMWPETLAVNKLAAAIYFTCQGRLFMLSGEEFARTKEGNEDSFNAPVELNCLDWERARENSGLVQYYSGLIRLRKMLPGLCDKSAQAWKRVSGQKKEALGCVSFLVDNSEGDGSRWATLFIAYNSSRKKCRLKLPGGNWQVLLADGDSLCWEKDERFMAEEAAVSPVSAMILGRV